MATKPKAKTAAPEQGALDLKQPKAKAKAPAKPKTPKAAPKTKAAPKSPAPKVKADSPVATRSAPKTATGSGGGGKPPATRSSTAAGSQGPRKAVGPARTPRVEKDMGKAQVVDTKKRLTGPAKEAAKKGGGFLSKIGRAAGWVGLGLAALDQVPEKKGELGGGPKARGQVMRKEATSSKPAPKKKSNAPDVTFKEGSDVPQVKGSPNRSKSPAGGDKKPSSGSVKTKGGTYPVYKKDSANAKSFRAAFAAARKGGAKVFTWEGRKYNTKLKGE